jgi:hypothetical protein
MNLNYMFMYIPGSTKSNYTQNVVSYYIATKND